MRAYVSRIIQPEEYADMSREELYDLLQKELYVDETQNGQEFHHKELAQYIERAMYVCPRCGLSEFHSEKDIVTCKKCGGQIRYLPNQRLEGIDWDFPFPYVAQWYQHQESYVNHIDTFAHLEQPLFEDIADLSLVEPYKKKVPVAKDAHFLLYGNRIQAGDKTLFFEDISVITVLGKNKLNVYHTDALYQIKGDCRFNALKYMNLFYRHKNQKAGQGDFLGI